MSDQTTPLSTGGTPSDEDHKQAQPEPQWITGPSAPTLLAGLLTLVIAALAIVRLSTDVEVDWSIAAPVTVIAVGFIAVVLGAASFSRRSRQAEHESTE